MKKGSLEFKPNVSPKSVFQKGAFGGTYYMTSEFLNGRPVYLNPAEDWYVWFDGDESTWIASDGDQNKVVKHVKNNLSVPQYGWYVSDHFPEYTLEPSEYDCIQVLDFTGSVESANGIYCAVSTYNDKPVYSNGTKIWYMYFDGLEWVIGDAPHTRERRWITNSSSSEYTDYNNHTGNNGSVEFYNQLGDVQALGIPEEALLTEEDETPLLVEDEESAVSREG